MRRAPPAPLRPARVVQVGQRNPPKPEIVRRIDASLTTVLEGVGGIAPLSMNDTLALLGDSYIDNGIGRSTNLIQINDAGAVWPYGWSLGGGLLTLPAAGEQGNSGDNVAAIDARVAATNATNGAVVIYNGGINDIRNGATAAATFATIQSTLAALTARYVIICTLPTLYGANALDGPKTAQLALLNASIAGLASARIKVADIAAMVTDSTFMGSDGLHLSHKGELGAGRIIGPILTAISATTDAAAALVAVAISANAGMTGTAGGKTNATGSMASNYGLSGQAASFSTVASKAGNGEQIITTSGTYTGAGGNQFWSISQDAPCTLVAGDIIELFAKWKVLTNISNLSSIQIFNQIYSSDYGTIYAQQYLPLGSVQLYVDSDGYYVMRAPQLACGAGAGGAHIDTFFQLYFKDGTSLSATGAIQIAALGARKVN